MTKYVASTTLQKPDWADTTVLDGDLGEEVTALKRQPGQDILSYGFGPVAQTLLRHGLLDEVRLSIQSWPGWSDPLLQAGALARLDLAEHPTSTSRCGMAELTTEGGMMIARMWRGWVRTQRLAEYIDIVKRTGLAEYRQTPGNAGAQLLTRDLGDGRTELITLSWWSDLDDIRAFAGDDITAAKYYPEDDEYLLDREPTVAHFEVAEPHQRPDQVPAAGQLELDDPGAGFTITRVLPGDPARVFAHFTQPAAFSRWFVVAGYTTPAARVVLDVRPGGTINAVLLPDQDGPEIPFAATYGRVDPPHTVQFAFTNPTELVTITLLDLGEQGTQLTYRNQGAPLRGRAQALVGVARMLDALEASVAAAKVGGS